MFINALSRRCHRRKHPREEAVHEHAVRVPLGRQALQHRQAVRIRILQLSFGVGNVGLAPLGPVRKRCVGTVLLELRSYRPGERKFGHVSMVTEWLVLLEGRFSLDGGFRNLVKTSELQNWKRGSSAFPAFVDGKFFFVNPGNISVYCWATS